VRVLFGSNPDFEAQADDLYASSAASAISQHPAWSDLASGARLQSYRRFLCVDDGERVVCSGLVRLTRFLPGRFSAAIRRGPITRSPEELAAVLPALEVALRKVGVSVLSVNPYWREEEAVRAQAILAGLGYRRVSPSAQTLPTRTALVDLRGSPQEIMARFSQRRRRELRAGAEKRAVVRPVESRQVAAGLTEIMKKMASATGMEIDNQHDFVRHQICLAARPDLGAIHAAYLNGQLIAGSVSYREGTRCYSLLMASLPDLTGPSRSTDLYWADMMRATEAGCLEFDMAGYPDPDRQGSDRSAAGRGEFKDSFHPRIVALTPIMEKALRPLEYAAFNTARAMYRGSPLRRRMKAILHRFG
jgi:lipid II:glycine glycyltransferase (peptidoglycan interpeptide bridge formation enzyme)